jgi:hypothetical protein
LRLFDFDAFRRCLSNFYFFCSVVLSHFLSHYPIVIYSLTQTEPSLDEPQNVGRLLLLANPHGHHPPLPQPLFKLLALQQLESLGFCTEDLSASVARAVPLE